MQTEEITESLENGTIESLQEDLEYAEWILNRTHPLVRLRPDRRAAWVDYRDQVLAEIASRA